jgi:lipoyl(octanoyl) transferase
MHARVTLHGFAINCDTDLAWFGGIVACGLPNHGVTSLSEIAGRVVTVAELRPLVRRHLADVFRLAFTPIPDDEPHLWLDVGERAGLRSG